MQTKIAKLLILLVISFLFFILGYSYLPSNIARNSNLVNTKFPQTSLSESQVLIIVDMGSTGTRMYAYQISLDQKNATQIPLITEIATAKSTDQKAVAQYCNNSQAVGEHIIPLYKELADKLNTLNVDIKRTPIYFMATAGMRLYAKDQQNAVYKKLIEILQNEGHDGKMLAKTIPGELEGIFDWLSVNYKLQTLQNNLPTVAALDMGGASTQVAMEYDENKYKKDRIYSHNIYSLHLNKRTYKIYSKSILGYGLNQTKKRIAHFKNKEIEDHCSLTSSIQYDNHQHALGYDLNQETVSKANSQSTKSKKLNDFNFSSCSKLITAYLNTKKDHAQIAKVIKRAVHENMQFIAFSGYYYKFNFFNSKNPEDFIKAIPDSCHMHRNEFKQKFSHLSENELNESCFDATYLKILLNHAYNIPEYYNNFIIPKHDIDWTIGAALFISTNQTWID